MPTSTPQAQTVTMILAGGEGERLHPLTRDRAKPAVYLAGIYRIIDFTLSNCLNSGFRRLFLLTQYKSLSLDRHIHRGWDIFNSELGEYIYTVPPQQRMTKQWYQGTADAIHQNIYILEMEKPHWVLILSGDHIYRMDYRPLLRFHLDRGAGLTLSCVEQPLSEARRLGVAEVDEDCRIVAFQEKPGQPAPIPGKPDHALCSMGVYVFNTDCLVKAVIEDAKKDTEHDFGRDVVPALVKTGGVFAYNYQEQSPEGPAYWRDIGTLDTYYQANMDLLSPDPPFELSDHEWPLRTLTEQYPPVQISGEAVVHNSLVSPGCVIAGGEIRHSVLGYGVRVHPEALIEDSIIFPDVAIHRGTVVRRAIIDRYVTVPAGTHLGTDAEADAKRFTVTPTGIVVIPRVSPALEMELLPT